MERAFRTLEVSYRPVLPILAAVSSTFAFELAFAAESSALDPAGTQAEVIAGLWWWMLWASAAVAAVVLGLGIVALVTTSSDAGPRPPLGDTKFIIIGGAALPFLILTVLLIKMLISTDRMLPKSADLTVKVTGHMWWWEVTYPEAGIRTANELYVPVGKDVRVELSAKDVIHSFWVPSLGGKTDALPGSVTTHWITAKRAGTYRGQCAEFCGLQHAHMAFHVVAVPDQMFLHWIAEKQAALKAAARLEGSTGFSLFKRAGCAACHAIGGTSADSEIGPDLTHIGSRLSLGAGTAVNNYGNLAGWIANSQALKPGNKMPRAYVTSDELGGLTELLWGLK